MTAFDKLFTFGDEGWGAAYVDTTANRVDLLIGDKLFRPKQVSHQWSMSESEGSPPGDPDHPAYALTPDERRIRYWLQVNTVPVQNLAFADPCLPRGHHHPRVCRQKNAVNPAEQYGDDYVSTFVATSNLYTEIRDLFRIIEPNQSNFNVFGHRIRELLILVCTEIESQWSSTMIALGLAVTGDRLDTKKYIQLKNILRLDQYAVRLSDYTVVAEFQPYKDWNPDRPTKSLWWYHSYNDVKHHREANFGKATMEALLTAATALHATFVAQFGTDRIEPPVAEFRPLFRTTKRPKWEPQDLYLPPHPEPGGEWTAVPWVSQ